MIVGTWTISSQLQEGSSSAVHWLTFFSWDVRTHQKIRSMISWSLCSFFVFCWLVAYRYLCWLLDLEIQLSSGFEMVLLFSRWEDRHFWSWYHIWMVCNQKLLQVIYQHQRVGLPNHWTKTSCHPNSKSVSNNDHYQLSQYARQPLSIYSENIPPLWPPFLPPNLPWTLYSSWFLVVNKVPNWVKVGISNNHWFWS